MVTGRRLANSFFGLVDPFFNTCEDGGTPKLGTVTKLTSP